MQDSLLVRVGSPFVKGMFFHKTLMILLIKNDLETAGSR